MFIGEAELAGDLLEIAGLLVSKSISRKSTDLFSVAFFSACISDSKESHCTTYEPLRQEETSGGFETN